MTFGKLLVTVDLSAFATHQKVPCVCECGNQKTVRKAHLTSGATVSCGCLMRQTGRTHGLSHTRTYSCWKNMLARCVRASSKRLYPTYALRDVTSDWRSFANFHRDMGDCPEGYTLDRIDNAKGYSAENCRWATAKTQANNKGSNRKVNAFGKILNFTQLIEISSINKNTAWKRFLAGWPPEAACFAPLGTRSVNARSGCWEPEGWKPPDIEGELKKQGWEG